MLDNLADIRWTAQIDRMPGAASFRVFGTITVGNTANIPTLVRSEIQDKPCDLRLDLKANPNQIGLTVITQAIVEYKSADIPNVTSVSIYFEGKLMACINEILITD
ncbi:hypothetical protein PMI26_01250 [Pseudomonas sp. GM33]|uniref:hypothetical protein n=1 Tax=Pseudomonas TaxID=286 RepID=UPI00027022CD|nr:MULTISPECIES: hypothetical protein [Pseudomonas]EJM47116.1 hypothetical protein PMI26_01250 [Pseudomonas sp. GM33]MDP9652264.1 hypothetical protein [Pseudomonas putida]UVM05046.1 hypothetical protein LOY25_29325 [Pseudomonas laurylsulfatiphila]